MTSISRPHSTPQLIINKSWVNTNGRVDNWRPHPYPPRNGPPRLNVCPGKGGPFHPLITPHPTIQPLEKEEKKQNHKQQDNNHTEAHHTENKKKKTKKKQTPPPVPPLRVTTPRPNPVPAEPQLPGCSQLSLVAAEESERIPGRPNWTIDLELGSLSPANRP